MDRFEGDPGPGIRRRATPTSIQHLLTLNAPIPYFLDTRIVISVASCMHVDAAAPCRQSLPLPSGAGADAPLVLPLRSAWGLLWPHIHS